MRIIITGVPGTGKTTVSKILSEKLNIPHIDVNDIIEKNKSLILGFDEERNSKIIDEKKLGIILEKYAGIIESHLSHFVSPEGIDYCFVLRCSSAVLSKRLSMRNYSKKKIEENIEAEIMNICGDEAFQMKHKIIEIDTSDKTPEKVAEIIFNIVSKK